MATAIPKFRDIVAAEILNPNGFFMCEGICDHYNDVFPAKLIGVIPEDMFFRTINRINRFVFTYFPGRMRCRCRNPGGESCPKFVYIKKFLLNLVNILDDENRNHYQHFHIRWSYITRMNYNYNLIEYVIEIKFYVKMSCHY